MRTTVAKTVDKKTLICHAEEGVQQRDDGLKRNGFGARVLIELAVPFPWSGACLFAPPRAESVAPGRSCAALVLAAEGVFAQSWPL